MNRHGTINGIGLEEARRSFAFSEASLTALFEVNGFFLELLAEAARDPTPKRPAWNAALRPQACQLTAAARARIARCPVCKVAVWSNYPGAGPAVRFVRVGTMDDPTQCPPDVHIFTSTKQPWVTLPPGARAFAEFYDIDEVWSDEARERRRALRERVKKA